jgi:hypothetical protein
MVVDSVPVPVDIMAREQRYKAFRKSFETAPVKGNSAVNRCWFICYKLHVVIFDNGMIQQRAITKGNVHDINYFKTIYYIPSGNRFNRQPVLSLKPVTNRLFKKIRGEFIRPLQ